MSSVQIRLMAMMFLQYFVWGAWGVSLGGYMGTTLSFSGGELTSVYATTAIATMVSPLFLGYIADRFFSTERILAVLHLAGAGLLYYASTATEYSQLWTVMLAYSLCFMPTLALTNSISFENIRSAEKDFPIIRVFGTLGWIAAGVAVGQLGWGLDSRQLLLAAGTSALLGVFCLFLPHTPPKGKQAVAQSGAPRTGLLHLLLERSFLVFTIASFLICIPLAFYYNLANLFLTEIDAPAPTALQTIGQMSEVFFMAVMPWFIMRLGVKKMLAVGMLAWVVRYFAFGSLVFPLIVIGLLLHGICYDFFFVASQIYVDSKADLDQRARAQSFIAFVTLGLGMFVGAKVAGYTLDHYAPGNNRERLVQAASAGFDPKTIAAAELLEWDTAGKTDFAVALKIDAKNSVAFKDEAAQAALPEQFTFTKPDKESVTYTRAQLIDALKLADATYGNNDGIVERSEWRASQAHDWFHIWLWPALAAGATLIFFWFGFNDRIASRDATGGAAH